MWAPVSLAVLGGLTTSTFLTLVILPPVYSYMDDISQGIVWIIKNSVAFFSSPREYFLNIRRGKVSG